MLFRSLAVGAGGTGVTVSTGSGTLTLANGPTLTNPTLATTETWTSIAPPAWAAGTLYYDNTNDVLDFYNGSASVQNDVHLGSEVQFAVYNSTGSTIPMGSAVYITGQHAQIPTVALAQANSAATTNAIGLTNTAIPNNTQGYVVVLGKFTGINTSGFTSSQLLFLSDSVAGGLTNVAPTASTSFQVPIAYCTYSNPSNGVVELIGPLQIGRAHV